MVVRGDRRPAAAARRQRGEEIARAEKRSPSFPRFFTTSIKYGLDHRAAGVEHALPLGRGLDRALADKFIGMYVNELTLDYGERGKKGVREFLDRAHHAGLIPAPVELEFV